MRVQSLDRQWSRGYRGGVVALRLYVRACVCALLRAPKQATRPAPLRAKPKAPARRGAIYLGSVLQSPGLCDDGCAMRTSTSL